MAEKVPFMPDWKLDPAEDLAIRLSIALHKHVPTWCGAEDEELIAVAKELLGLEPLLFERRAEEADAEAMFFGRLP